MSCSHPIAIPVDDKKKFHKQTNSNASHRMVPCGKCYSCLKAKKMEWATRCMHEANFHEHSLFITLTYDEICVPKDGSLNKEDITNFIKRTRSHFKYHHNITGIKYIQAGEYGRVCENCGNHFRRCRCGNYVETLGRPHHHICLFGITFNDKKLSKKTKDTRYPLYESEILDTLWQKGIAVIGELNVKTAAYTASYITKRMIDSGNTDKYNGKLPEYATMSRREGIGKKYAEKYKSNFINNDFVIVDKGKKVKIPRYYDKLTERSNPDEYELIKQRRGKRYKIPDKVELMHKRQKNRNDIRKQKMEKDLK